MDWGPWASDTYGKKPMEIRGPFTTKQRRLNPDGEFMQKDREWRKQWIKDQKLSNKDAAMHRMDIYFNKDYKKARYNIFRRIWQTPMDLFERNVLQKFFNKDTAHLVRFTTSFGLKAYVLGVWVAYYMMYRTNDWTQNANFSFRTSRPKYLPGEPGYDSPPERTKPSDYGARDFKNSSI